ncbi:MAG: hypothetical protein ACRBB5_07365 [Nitrosopumilus sp.]
MTGMPEEVFWGFIDADRNIKENILESHQSITIKEPQNHIGSMIVVEVTLAIIAVETKVAARIMSPS